MKRWRNSVSRRGAPGKTSRRAGSRSGNCFLGSGCAPARFCSKSRIRAHRATRWTKSAKVFRKRFAGGADCCAESLSPAISAGATALKLKKSRARHIVAVTILCPARFDEDHPTKQEGKEHT